LRCGFCLTFARRYAPAAGRVIPTAPYEPSPIVAVVTRLDTLPWPAVREYLERDDRVIIVFGSTENNGPHLPLGSDTLAAAAVAEEASERTGVLIAPAIPWGNSSVNMGFAGTIALDPRILADLVSGICSSLAYHGFRRVAVVSGHYGNVWPVASVAEALRDAGILVAQLDLWRTVERDCRDLAVTTTMPFGHGGEVMTSVVSAAGGTPDNSRLTVEVPDEAYGLKYYRSYPEVMGFSAWDEVSKSGGVGDPRAATAEAGRKAIMRVASVLVELLEDMRAASLPAVRGYS
jgi:creatinine amidohydrolase